MKRLIAAASAALMVMVTAGAAMAAPPESSGAVERGDVPQTGFFYRNGEHIVLTGPDWEQGCIEEGFTPGDGSTISPGNDSALLHFTVNDERVMVFEDTAGPADEDIFPWLAAACEAALDGDPKTLAPEPVAVGEGKLTYRERVDTSGVVHVHNGIVGKVVTGDDDLVHLDAAAQFTVTDGVVELHILKVNYGG